MKLSATITTVTMLVGTAIAGLVASTSADASVAACGNASLDYGITPTQGAAGTGSFVLLYRNHTAATCTLRGYPGLDAMSSAGYVITHAVRTVSGSAGGASHGVQTISIPPHGFASATVEWKNFNPVTSGSCRFSAGVNTIAPNTTKLVPFHRAVSICSLQVHPVVPGWTGRD
ncbi:MAG TPA: DUF4232 domain-containing protein [Jatrophihabitans sp.]|nr:DUF4232 domain-containing protein [Jatrophihabitans sp.]